MELGQHRRELVGITDPDGRRELWCVADEPRVAEVLGRAGLPRSDTVRQCGRFPRPGADHAFEDARQQRVLAARQRRMVHGAVVVDELPGSVADACNGARAVAEHAAVDAAPVVCEGRVRTRHLERAHVVGAEPDREIRIEVARDADLMRGLRDVARPD